MIFEIIKDEGTKSLVKEGLNVYFVAMAKLERIND